MIACSCFWTNERPNFFTAIPARASRFHRRDDTPSVMFNISRESTPASKSHGKMQRLCRLMRRYQPRAPARVGEAVRRTFLTAKGEAWQTLPPNWRDAARTQLADGETLLAWFEPDLDAQLQYAPSVVLLTDRRLLAATQPSAWQSFRLTPNLTLRHREQGGAGLLELSDDNGRLASWRYTGGRAQGAARLVQRRETYLKEQRGETALSVTVCPSCGAVITSPDGVCTACNPEATPPRYAALFRLLRFARRRARLIFLGFLLTVASTAASLVPPYLYKPLIDDVLEPRRNFQLVPWLLGGIALATVLTWILDWGRIFVLAYTSEYIAADLRQETYAHLQRLSMEYFGGKRTGDLISRISSDSTRICNYLSMNVVDFAADCIMILMVSAVLLYTNPPLALAALLPFPLVMWLVYFVRGRLLRHYRRSGVAESEMTSILADTIPGIRVVKAFAQETREIERFHDANDHVLRANN